MIRYLKQIPNDHICTIGTAVSDLVVALFRGTLLPTMVSNLEMTDPSIILNYPKGCAMLLDLFSTLRQI